MKQTVFAQQKIGVFGLGKAGTATVSALLEAGAEVFAWDDKYEGIRPEAIGNSASLLPYCEWPWAELAALVIAPGVPLTHPKPHEVVMMAKQYNLPVTGDIEILYRLRPEATYIAITGTNGKSTTTTLIGHILQSAGKRCEVGGNLGTAALALAPLGKGEIYVLETSSYQLDLVKTTRFNVAVFLNITPDHLDRHGDMAGYIAAKKHIFDRQTKDDVAVIAVDDAYTQGIRDRALGMGGSKVVSISNAQILSDGVYVKDGILYDNMSLFPHPPSPVTINDIATLTGAHNWQNAAAAYAAARAVGVAPEEIAAAMQTFPGLSHRLQLVATIRGVRFINDSKATNADATSHALKPYQNIYWIAGGKAKAGGIESLAPLFSHIKRAYLIGEAQDAFAATLKGKVETVMCGTLDNAVKDAADDAFAEAIADAVVLLSPACASFDQFDSFEHRGDVFCELVEGINDAS